MQKKKQTEQEKGSANLDSLKQKFEAEVKNKVATQREIQIKFNVCCGCGCYYFKGTLRVPYDSPLQDGATLRYSDFNRDDLLNYEEIDEYGEN